MRTLSWLNFLWTWHCKKTLDLMKLAQRVKCFGILERLEPSAVREIPMVLEYKEIDYDRNSTYSRDVEPGKQPG